MDTQVHSFTAGDGARLYAEVHAPTGPARGQVLAIPAMMVDRRTFDRPRGRGFARALAVRGLRVHTLDLRGHGESRPGAREGRDWSYDDLVAHDIPAAIRHVRDQAPALPLCVIGHSLGGHASAAALGLAAGDGLVDALVMIAANVWTPALEPDPLIMALRRTLLAGFRAVTRCAGRFPARALGIGTDDEAPSYVSAFPRWAAHRWSSDDGEVDYLAAVARVDVPVLAVTAAGDALMCPPASGRAFARRVGGPAGDVTAWQIGRGLLRARREPGHMTLVTDARSAPAWRLIADWIVERTARAAPTR